MTSGYGLSLGGCCSGPGGKILSCYAELYYLLQVEAPTRLLVLTNPEFYEIFVQDSRDRLAPGLGLKLVQLSDEIQRQIDEVTRSASREMAGMSAAVDEMADLAVSGDLEAT